MLLCVKIEIMANGFTLKVQFNIKAPLETVWDALTNPAMIKQYFFGTELDTSWKVGDPIFWRGAWEGVTYEDKGTVLEFEHLKQLKYNYWSSMGGTPDLPENYADITYEVEKTAGGTLLTITQTGLASEEKREHSEQSWKGIVEGMEALIV